MLNVDNYHPIRQRMVWVGIIQFVASGLILAGIGAEVVDGWAAWLTGGLNLLILAGVLVQGTKASEENTVPVDDAGLPLNPEYALKDEFRGE